MHKNHLQTTKVAAHGLSQADAHEDTHAVEKDIVPLAVPVVLVARKVFAPHTLERLHPSVRIALVAIDQLFRVRRRQPILDHLPRDAQDKQLTRKVRIEEGQDAEEEKM